MKKYKVLIEGRNLLLNVDGQEQKIGFFTTRWIEANNANDAEKFAIENIRNDPKIKNNILNFKTDPPFMHASEVEEVNFLSGKETNTGFVFFPEESD